MTTFADPTVATSLEELVRIRHHLQLDIRRLTLRSDAVAARIRDQVAVGDVREVGRFVVRVAPPPRILVVVDPTLVPEAFLTLQPDRDALRGRWLSTGVLPSGCRAADRRPAVIVERCLLPRPLLQ